MTRTLLLIPTRLELRRLHDLGGFPADAADVELCGFGPVAAAARTAQLLAGRRPRRCLLVGIAGAYDVDRHTTGTALSFARVASEGIGVGCGADFQGPPRLGFPQWPGSPETGEAVHEELALCPVEEKPAALLLTTCGASDGPALAGERRRRFPDAAAEDMEGFGAALACALFRTPLAIVRGISNAVGDRDPAHWRIPAALSAAHRRALELLADDAWGAPA